MPDKIVIEVSDNRVTAVWSSNPEAKVEILDWDLIEFDENMKELDEDDMMYANKIRGLYLIEPKE